MPVEYPEHPIIADARDYRGYDESVSHEEVMKREALRLALLGPEQRFNELRNFDNKVTMYDESGTNLRQKSQAHRFGSYLRGAHEKLKAAGR